jgi:hypothetical protein
LPEAALEAEGCLKRVAADARRIFRARRAQAEREPRRPLLPGRR